MSVQFTYGKSSFPLAFAIPPDIEGKVESVEIEFVHDGKERASVSGKVDGFGGARITERTQIAAPPHAIVFVKTKRVEGEDRVLDRYGVVPTLTVNGVAGLPLNERNSIPLRGGLPQGDAPKAVAEGVVATG